MASAPRALQPLRTE